MRGFGTSSRVGNRRKDGGVGGKPEETEVVDYTVGKRSSLVGSPFRQRCGEIISTP